MSRSHEANKLPSQNLDAERGVLGSVMLFPECLDDVTAVIKPDDFYLDAHREIMHAMQRLRDDGVGIDALTISDDLERHGKLVEVGGNEYLMRVVESVPHGAHAVHYAGAVRNCCRQRHLVYTGTEMARQGYDRNCDVDAALAAAADAIMAQMENRATSAETIHQVALRSMDRLTQPKPPGITLGFSELDERLHGAKAGQVIVIGGRPGTGKSAIVTNIVHHVAQRSGVLIASIEMTADELFDRMLCSQLGVSLGELRPLARDETKADSLDEARTSIAQLPIVIDDSTDQTVASIGARARIMKRKQGLGLIVVDYLQLVTPTNKRDPREQQVATVAWGLKVLAKQLEVPVIALVQLNREIEKRPDKSPKLSDIRESGAIEQHAAVIMFLDRPAQWEPDKHDDDEAVLYLAKNRGGSTGKIDLKWDGRSATFSEPFAISGADAFDGPGDGDF